MSKQRKAIMFVVNIDSTSYRLNKVRQFILNTFLTLEKTDCLGVISYDKEQHTNIPLSIVGDIKDNLENLFESPGSFGEKGSLRKALFTADTKLRKFIDTTNYIIIISDFYLEYDEIADYKYNFGLNIAITIMDVINEILFAIK